MCGTQALIRDFNRLGYKVYSPIDNWSGRITYYREGATSLDSKFLKDTELITYNQFIDIKPSHVVAGCFEQYEDFTKLADEVGAKIVIGVAGNDQPIYRADYLLSPDIATFSKYQIKTKLLWLHEPVIPFVEKDIIKAYEGKVINSYVSNYEEFFPVGYNYATQFKKEWKTCTFYGQEFEYIEDRNELAKKYVDSMFTMYFKDIDCYGQVVLESMALGTPVIAIQSLIHGKTLGTYFLNDSNAIIGDTLQTIYAKLNRLTLEEYKAMSMNAQNTIRYLTEPTQRIAKMREIGL